MCCSNIASLCKHVAILITAVSTKKKSEKAEGSRILCISFNEFQVFK